jgi:predicted phage tail protein
MTDAEKIRALEHRVNGLEEDLEKALDAVQKFGVAKWRKDMSDNAFRELEVAIGFVQMNARSRKKEEAEKP